MGRRVLVVMVVALTAACGGGSAGPPDASPPDAADNCPPRPAFPTGLLSDPLAIPLPFECVESGIGGLGGRWFIAADDFNVLWGHPRFELGCRGMREFHDAESWDTGASRHDTWSDDTRIVIRDGHVGTHVTYASVNAACVLSDGTIAAVNAAQFVIDGVTNDPFYTPLTARPFGWKDEAADGLTLVGSLAARGDHTAIAGYSLVVDGGFAYVAGGTGFDVIDVGDPAHPAAVGHVDGYVSDVRVAHGGGRTIAYLADDTTRLIDVTDPAAPAAIGAIGAPSYAMQLVDGAGGPRLYLTNQADGTIAVYDVSAPLVPAPIGTVTDPDSSAAVYDLSVDGSMIYASASYDGTLAIDVSAGFGAAVEVGRFQLETATSSHASWVGTAGGRAIVLVSDAGEAGSSHGLPYLRVLDGDRASPGFMTEIGRYQTRREVDLNRIVMVGDRAYLAYDEDGVRVVDLSDPTAPVEVAHYNTWLDPNAGTYSGGAYGLRVVGDLIYIADETAGLVILRDPALTP